MGQVALDYELDIAPESRWLIVTPNPQAKAAFIYTQEVGDFFAGPKYYTERRCLDSYLIKFTVSGQGTLDYCDRSYTLSPGDIFFIDCVNEQYYRTRPAPGEWHVLWVHFFGANAAQYYAQFMQLNGNANTLSMPSMSEVPEHLRALLNIYKSGGTSDVSADIRAASHIISILTEIISTAAAHAGHSGAPECVVGAIDYIRGHFRETITLDLFADQFSMNKFYFQKLFKKHTGYSPNEFLTFTRIKEAKELLRGTNASIDEIAAAVGMQYTSHFINVFKRHEGVTPGIFRRQWFGKR